MSDDSRPPLTMTVQRAEGPLEVKMTYGLEMDLRRVLHNPDIAMQLAMSDYETQDYIVRRCLTPLAKAVTDPAELIPVEAVDISTEDSDALILWAVEHQLYFFAKRARGVMDLAVRQKTAFQPARMTDGSPDSTSTTQSAGPSESSKETSSASTGDTPVEN